MLDDKLRDEIIESQKTQSQLAKWKLILVATIAATALGSVPNVSPTGRVGVLAILPIVCIYVDALCFHTGARIMTIARYFRTRAKGRLLSGNSSVSTSVSEYDSYEWYCLKHRRHFAVEGFAMLGVTVIASATVWAVGMNTDVRELFTIDPRAADSARWILAVSGISGFVLGPLFFIAHRIEMYGLDYAPAGVPSAQIWTEFRRRGVDHQLTHLWRVLRKDLPGWTERCDASRNEISLDIDNTGYRTRQLRLIGAAVKYSRATGKTIRFEPARAESQTVHADANIGEPSIAPKMDISRQEIRRE
jgi:hypothetical protein